MQILLKDHWLSYYSISAWWQSFRNNLHHLGLGIKQEKKVLHASPFFLLLEEVGFSVVGEVCVLSADLVEVVFPEVTAPQCPPLACSGSILWDLEGALLPEHLDLGKKVTFKL